MATRLRMWFAWGVLAWLVATVLVLSILGSFSYGLFFTFALIGLLVVTELTAPLSVTPRWRTHIRWLIVLGFVGFVVVISRRVYEILPPELLP
ncbi:hypothetical protein ACFO5R_09790 [Halosolutus amylolyticus]|uniref:Uncharacterized protein n=1 Tax=Halosolutus amylolyticus TaxID=2932267 RepID=A0ABD5PP28_9EURY|nr:hypothetical protein [Halosolutus amylolyticus]